jgi:hypothetical protein
MGGKIPSRSRRDRSEAKKGVRTWPRCAHKGRKDENHIGETSSATKGVTRRLKPLDEAIRVAMRKSETDLRLELGYFHCPEEVNFQDRVVIHGHDITTYRTSNSHGVIFFQEAAASDALVPGQVRAIFLVTQDGVERTFLAIHRFLAPATSLPDPFARYPDFGASIWSSETQKEVTIVPGSRSIYHAIYRDWDFKIMAMKPLNRVSNLI